MTGEWGQAVTNRIAARIKELRGERSAQWIEDRTSELGHRISRATVWELESGQRKTITMQDLLMLAAALGVKVADLLYPDAGMVEVLPGVEVRRDEALYQLVDMSASRQQLLDAYAEIQADIRSLQAHTGALMNQLVQKITEADLSTAPPFITRANPFDTPADPGDGDGR
jgi:transcriptional regulator with XRE-family HTH domain